MQNNSFIDGYNEKFNEYANKLAAGFFSRIRVDLDNIKSKSSGLILDKFNHIDRIITDDNKNNYDKVKLTGSILMDITPDLLSQPNEDLKKSGVNIINGLFEVARKTEDSELMQTAKSIADSAQKAGATSKS